MIHSQGAASSPERSPLIDRQAHAVIVGPGHWGQQALSHLLHRAVAHGGRVTMVVPRRDLRRFESRAPIPPEWKSDSNLKACLDRLRAEGKPVSYLFDDQLSQLASELIAERRKGAVLTVGYVTTLAEDHFACARFLVDFCERVLVEKPVSRVASEVARRGDFEKLADHATTRGCVLRVAEHYLFRPGVSQALDPRDTEPLAKFLERHANCPLRYEFRFLEPGDRAGPLQDGAILDTLTSHGLGPVARILLPLLESTPPDESLDQRFHVLGLKPLRAIDGNGHPHYEILTETAARLAGRIDRAGARPLQIELVSGKGHERYERYWRVQCDQCTVANSRPYYGVSLGSTGSTVDDIDQSSGTSQRVHVERQAGFESDKHGEPHSEAANAHAAMLNALLGEEFARDGLDRRQLSRFLTIPEACAIVRLGLRLQAAGSMGAMAPYRWNERIPVEPSVPEENFQADSSRQGGKSDRPDTVSSLIDGMGLGEAHASPNWRIVTVFGAEGSGRWQAFHELKRNLDIGPSKEVIVCDLIVPRHMDDSADEEAQSFALDQLCRRIAERCGAVLESGVLPDRALLELLRKEGLGPQVFERKRIVILFYGVDRVPERLWPRLVRVLAAMPVNVCMVFFTSNSLRACGHIVRIDDFKPGRWVEENANAGDLPKQAKDLIARYAVGNPGIARILNETLFFKKHRRLRQNRDEGTLLALLEDYLAALAIPEPLMPDSTSVLSRVALAAMARLPMEDRRLITALARLPGRMSRDVLERSFGDVEARIQEEAVGIAFDKTRHILYPEFQRIAVDASDVQLERTYAEVESRYLTLAFRVADKHGTRQLRGGANPGTADARGGDLVREQRPVVQMAVESLLQVNLSRCDLAAEPFEELILELFRTVEVSADATGNEAVFSLVRRLLEPDSRRATNLPLLARAKALYLLGRSKDESAGGDPAKVNEALEYLRHAFWIADAFRESPPESLPRSRVSPSLMWHLAIQGWRLARLRASGCWHTLFGATALPEQSDPLWRRDGAAAWKEACPEGCCSDDEIDRWMKNLLAGVPPDRVWVAKKTAAVVLRTRALELSVAPESGSTLPEPKQAAVSLLLKAASLNEEVAPDCQARNFIDAALVSVDHDDSQRFIEKSLEIWARGKRSSIDAYRELVKWKLDRKSCELKALAVRLAASGESWLARVAEELAQPQKNNLGISDFAPDSRLLGQPRQFGRSS